MADKELLAKLARAGVIPTDEAVRMVDFTFKQKPIARSFNSAQISNLTAGWATVPKPIDTDIRNGLRRLRARARHEAQNNDYVRRFISLCRTNVIGHTGIQLQARVADPNGKQDKLANDAIEAAWLAWGKKGVCDVTGRYSWRMIQRLFIDTIMRDGEVLIRRVRYWDGNKFGYALQFLDTELLDVEHNVELRNGNIIRMGVELDAWRKPVAYYLRTTLHTADNYEYNGQRYQRIPAADIIHEFLPEWVWQTRGIPPVATALMRLNMLAGYEDAELVASRASATKFGVYERTGEDVPTATADNFGQKQADGSFVQDADPGALEVLPDGYRLNYIDPQHPNSAYKDFVKAMLRGIASALDVSYNALANDLEGVNYSSLRQGNLNDRDVWMAMQDWVVESFCEPVYFDWLSHALFVGAITVMGKPLKGDREEKYRRITWQPRRWQWVDPQKELAAHQIAFTHKIRSPQSVIREMGHDPETVLDEWQQWNELLQAKNLKTEPATPAGSAVMESENNDETDNTDTQD